MDIKASDPTPIRCHATFNELGGGFQGSVTYLRFQRNADHQGGIHLEDYVKQR